MAIEQRERIKLYRLMHHKDFVELYKELLLYPQEQRQNDIFRRLFGKCLLIRHKYLEALTILSNITEHNLESFHDLLTCHEKLSADERLSRHEQISQIHTAIALIDKRLMLTYKVDFVLKKVDFLIMGRLYQDALDTVKEALQPFPDAQNLKVAHLECLSKLKDRHFFDAITLYKGQHPENIQLWMIEFWNLFYAPDQGDAKKLLMEIIHKFPMSIEAQLALIEFHVIKKDMISAGLNFILYQHMFDSLEPARLLAEEIVKKYPQLNLDKSVFPVKVELPRLLLDVFKILNVPGVNKTYLVGSVIHRLLSKLSLQGIDDIDFVSNGPPLAHTAFKPNLHIANLYSKFVADEGSWYRCECFVSPSIELINSDVLKRDFTVNSLYCDSKGNIFDPTGLGLLDLQHGIVRTIVSSGVSINEDPIRILRAIKLILRKLRLTPELEYAIREWKPQTELNFNHINAVCVKLMKTFDPILIITHLKNFDLLHKMFKLRVDILKDDEILVELWKQLQTTAPQNRVNKPSP